MQNRMKLNSLRKN